MEGACCPDRAAEGGRGQGPAQECTGCPELPKPECQEGAPRADKPTGPGASPPTPAIAGRPAWPGPRRGGHCQAGPCRPPGSPGANSPAELPTALRILGPLCWAREGLGDLRTLGSGLEWPGVDTGQGRMPHHLSSTTTWGVGAGSQSCWNLGLGRAACWRSTVETQEAGLTSSCPCCGSWN